MAPFLLEIEKMSYAEMISNLAAGALFLVLLALCNTMFDRPHQPQRAAQQAAPSPLAATPAQGTPCVRAGGAGARPAGGV